MGYGGCFLFCEMTSIGVLSNCVAAKLLHHTQLLARLGLVLVTLTASQQNVTVSLQMSELKQKRDEGNLCGMRHFLLALLAAFVSTKTSQADVKQHRVHAEAVNSPHAIVLRC